MTRLLVALRLRARPPARPVRPAGMPYAVRRIYTDHTPTTAAKEAAA